MFRSRATPPPAPKQVPRGQKYVQRAMRAYWRGESLQRAAFPDPAYSRLECWYGREYVILANPRCICAVYRVRAYDGVLRRMKRWPSYIQARSA